ncbi:MAG: M48 family metallopeptidase, partial [Bacteroidales bacterium]|nr:M48 family metallopeptidase [Bacteroidales bacterium]
MNTETIFILIIVILIVDYLIDRILDFLNASRWTESLPKQLQGIYDQKKYQEAQKYDKVKYNLGLIVSGVSFAAMLLMLISGGFGWLDNYLRQYTNHPILIAFLYFGILGFAADIMGTPFELYSTFIIEQRFGFNKSTLKIYIFDKLKSWLLSVLLGAPILALIIYIYESTGNNFWLLVWGVLTVFMLFMTMFYSNIIVPLFNKQTPLAEGELRDAIEAFATKVGFNLQNIYVIDGSKRSTKANAYFTGLGMKKRIILYDTLIKD